MGSDVIGRVFRAAIASPPAADTDASGSRDTSQLDDSAGESGSALTDDIGLAPLDDEVEGVPSDVKKKHPSGSGASLPTVAADRDETARDADVLPTAAGQTPPPPPNRKSLLEEEFERLEADPLFGHPMYRPFGETPVGRRQGAPVWMFVAVGIGVLLLIAMFVMLLFSPGS